MSRVAGPALAAALAVVAPRAAAPGVPLYLGDDGQPARHLLPVVSHRTVAANDPAAGDFVGDLAVEAAAIWSEVPTARLAFEQGLPVAEPIGVANYASWFARCGDGLSPLMADPDGAIVDDLLGLGASDAVLGLGIADCATEDGLVEEHTLLVNLAPLPAASPAREAVALRIVTHELGHVIGLAHTLLNAELAGDGVAANDAYLPMMAPVLSNDDPLAPALLALDDTSLVSLLYPAPGFVASTATIAGLAILPPAARPVSGTFVAVRGAGDPLATAVFSTSGLVPTGMVLGEAVAFPAGPGEPTGAFQASGLPPGAYTVEVTGGVNGESAEYFSGAGESHDPALDPPGGAVEITLGAGQVRNDVNLLLDAARDADATKLAETAWDVSWRGRAKVPGTSEKLPDGALPTPGRLELLASGGMALRSSAPFFDVLFRGRWAVRRQHGPGARRYAHRVGSAESLLAYGEALFNGLATFTEATGSGRVNASARKIRGSVRLRGRYGGAGRTLPLTLVFRYQGTRAALGGTAGPVPPVPPAAMIVSPALAAVAPGGQVGFSATVEGHAGGGGVTWTVVGGGTIDGAGLFTAPASGPQRTSIVARSAADPRITGLAAVDVQP